LKYEWFQFFSFRIEFFVALVMLLCLGHVSFLVHQHPHYDDPVLQWHTSGMGCNIYGFSTSAAAAAAAAASVAALP
jgi:hypothetical protein